MTWSLSDPVPQPAAAFRLLAVAAGEPILDAVAAGEPVSDAVAVGEPVSDTMAGGEPISDAVAVGEPVSDTLHRESCDSCPSACACVAGHSGSAPCVRSVRFLRRFIRRCGTWVVSTFDLLRTTLR